MAYHDADRILLVYLLHYTGRQLNVKTLLISFEGIDACGKTSTLKVVEKKLKKTGVKAISLNKKAIDGYPSQFLCDYMKKVSSLVWEFTSDDPVGDIPEQAWVHKHALWYIMLDRYIIEPLRGQYEVILIDGWYYKFLARHLSNGDFDFELTFKIFENIRSTDLSILFDVSPEECFRRRDDFKPSELGEHANREKISKRDRFIQYQGVVRKNYLSLASNENWKTLSLNNQSTEEISTLIYDSIKELLGNRYYIIEGGYIS